jgi:acetate kinase
MYAIPMDAYAKYKIRRYGFHGTSHHYVANRACKILNREKKTLRIITCHLGNGSSIAAIKQGKVIDTSMGFTPLEGVAMGTRCGDIDPTVVKYLMEKTKMSVDQTFEYLNQKSGMLGISGISSDFRDLLKAADLGNANAKLAIEIFCYRVKKNIGAYIAALGGVDVIVFTAGIGENATKVRQMIINDMEYLGIKLDAQKNKVRRQEIIISEDSSKVTVMVVPTNEELMIARETCMICRKLQEKQSAASV